MFSCIMQDSFDFAADDIGFIQISLIRTFGRLPDFERRQPIWKLVRSLIGSQTKDRVSEAAFQRLKDRWSTPRSLAEANPVDVLGVIDDVTYADSKTEYLVATLTWIGSERADFDLSFLKSWSVHDALLWLERFPGVGDKVAAATLNASTLAMRVFIVDCHVHRILRRFGFIGERASARRGRDEVTAAAEVLDAHDLFELFVWMKLLGQNVCHPKAPECGICPLASRCSKKTWLGVPKMESEATSRSKAFAFPRSNDDLVLPETTLQIAAEI